MSSVPMHTGYMRAVIEHIFPPNVKPTINVRIVVNDCMNMNDVTYRAILESLSIPVKVLDYKCKGSGV